MYVVNTLDMIFNAYISMFLRFKILLNDIFQRYWYVSLIDPTYERDRTVIFLLWIIWNLDHNVSYHNFKDCLMWSQEYTFNQNTFTFNGFINIVTQAHSESDVYSVYGGVAL